MPRLRVILIALVAVFVIIGLRLVPSLGYQPAPLPSTGDQLVVVGVEGRTALTDVDRQAVAERNAQVGTISIRPTLLGDCSAAGWATLGSGRRASVGELCEIRTTDFGVVTDWRDRTDAAAADHSDARLGTLSQLAAADGGACVASVGPGAALAAANPDGTNTAYQGVDAYVDSGFLSSCPITLVDAGEHSDEVITGLLGRAGTTVIVAGIGPPPGSDDPALQVVYRVGDGAPGWLTASSTRRAGVVQLTDLTRTMIDYAHRDTGVVAQPPVDGSPLGVVPGRVTTDAWSELLRDVAVLSDVPPPFFIGMGVVGAVALVVIIVGLRTGRFAWPDRILTAANLCLSTMMLVGVTQWWRTGAAVVVLVAGFAVIMAGLIWLTLTVGRRSGWPPAMVAAVVSAAAFTLEALSGGWAEPGSLINSRPIFAWRWYGFGNVTFAAYATVSLIAAGALAARALVGDGPRQTVTGRFPGLRAGLVVLGLGAVMIICQGWPTMGSDFGGVIAMVPGLLWLTIRVTGARVRWWAYPLLGGAAVVAVGLVAWLDWLRAPDARSHLGRFVQRVVDGDAADVVLRKATAMVDTVVNPWGLGALVIGVALWVAVFRYALPRLEAAQPTLAPTAVAVLVTAALGTVANDGGISVWVTATASFVVAMAGWLVWQVRRERASA